MTIRITCLPDEVAAAVDAVRRGFEVISESEPYPCRGRDRRVRVYLEVRPR